MLRITGYPAQTFVYGLPDYLDEYQRWDIQEGYEVISIVAHANLDGDYLQYLKFVSKTFDGLIEEKEFGDSVPEFESTDEEVESDSGASSSRMLSADPYEGLHQTWDFTARIIGFDATKGIFYSKSKNITSKNTITIEVSFIMCNLASICLIK